MPSQLKKLTFVCVATGPMNGQAEHYITRMHEMLKTFSPAPFDLLCITDNKRNIAPEIQQIDASTWQEFKRPKMHPTYYKIALFNQEYVNPPDFIYLDLSIIIQRSLTPLTKIAESEPNDLVGVRGWTGSTLNSCVMRVRNQSLKFIYDDFVAGKTYPEAVPGDQDFIAGSIRSREQEISFFPEDQIISFKKTMRLGAKDWDAAKNLADKALIVKFHGSPKPAKIFEPLYLQIRYGARYWIKGRTSFPINIRHLQSCWNNKSQEHLKSK